MLLHWCRKFLLLNFKYKIEYAAIEWPGRKVSCVDPVFSFLTDFNVRPFGQ